MKMSVRRIPSLFFCLALAGACGGSDEGDGDTGDGDTGDGDTGDGDTGDGDTGDGDTGDGDGDGDGVGPDAGTADGYEPLITAAWSLPPPNGPNPDRYWCARLTMTEDVLISGFRAISPNGTHHTVLSVGEAGGPDTSYECSVLDNHGALLFASGVGTDDFEFPEGVGIRVLAGQQVHVNLHLFNATDDDLSGTSGVAIKAVPAVETEAEFTFAGPIFIGQTIPPAGGDDELYPISGSCAVNQDATILNWWPHMHQLGRRMQIDVDGVPVHDEMFNFLEQINYPTTRQISAGSTIHVTCSYHNDTGSPVGWGDGSNAEMCFAGFYRYPKVGQDFCN